MLSSDLIFVSYEMVGGKFGFIKNLSRSGLVFLRVNL